MPTAMLARRFPLLLLLIASIAGCATSPTMSFRTAVKSAHTKPAGFSPAEMADIVANCPLGMPRHVSGVEFGTTQTIIREGYVLEHSAADKIPLWVCERVTREQLSGPLNRPKTEPFKADPLLAGFPRAELRDYKGSGYDRGHQAPSGDQTVSKQLQADTYYLSNMAPQFAALNQRIWNELEGNVRDLAKAQGTVYVVTGPLFYDPAEDHPATARGVVEFAVIGNGVAVPTHFYKILLWQDAAGPPGQWQGTAFVMKNQKEDFPKPYHFADYIKPIAWIEAETGLNFSPDLPEPEVARVEGAAGQFWN